MSYAVIRIYMYRDNVLQDMSVDFEVEHLGGIAPLVGDKVISDFVPAGLDREVPANRTIYTVTQRYFRVRENDHLIALVVEADAATEAEAILF